MTDRDYGSSISLSRGTLGCLTLWKMMEGLLVLHRMVRKKKLGTAMEIDSLVMSSSSVAAVIKRPSFAKNAAYGILVLFVFSCLYVCRRYSTLYRSDRRSDHND